MIGSRYYWGNSSSKYYLLISFISFFPSIWVSFSISTSFKSSTLILLIEFDRFSVFLFDFFVLLFPSSIDWFPFFFLQSILLYNYWVILISLIPAYNENIDWSMHSSRISLSSSVWISKRSSFYSSSIISWILFLTDTTDEVFNVCSFSAGEVYI